MRTWALQDLLGKGGERSSEERRTEGEHCFKGFFEGQNGGIGEAFIEKCVSEGSEWGKRRNRITPPHNL